jgi:single-strand DNA-binding protein
MANLNKVLLIGRLTRDPEVRSFSNGGKVAKFGFAVNNRKKNTQTGEWEEVPVFLDVEAFNRGEMGKTADRVEQYLRKGTQIFIEGHLVLDQWTTDNGEKRSKLKIVVDNWQFTEPKQDGEGGGRSGGSRPSSATARKPASSPPAEDHYEEPQDASGGDQDIPF